jgi:tRNA (guanine37-N1)-methyltransferase
MNFHVISIFPGMFRALTENGVVGRAISKEIVSLELWNPRDFTSDRHRTVDDRPYGGGPGMVMMAEPIVSAISGATADAPKGTRVIYLGPQGRSLDHGAVKGFAAEEALVLLCGRYEGVDERVLQHHVDEEWSIGDYVLSGGELPAMVLIDAIVRQLPGTLGNEESAEQDSFVDGLLDFGHYTRPETFENNRVPEVLLSGDHGAIRRWRLKSALRNTLERRPDLLQSAELTDEQQELMREIETERGQAPADISGLRMQTKTIGDK